MDGTDLNIRYSKQLKLFIQSTSNFVYLQQSIFLWLLLDLREKKTHFLADYCSSSTFCFFMPDWWEWWWKWRQKRWWYKGQLPKVRSTMQALFLCMGYSGALRNGQRLLVEILLDTYCTITQMTINIAQALNNCLIASYFSSQLLI